MIVSWHPPQAGTELHGLLPESASPRKTGEASNAHHQWRRGAQTHGIFLLLNHRVVLQRPAQRCSAQHSLL